MNEPTPGSIPMLLLMTVEPELAERVADVLAASGLPQGWHELAVEHAGGGAPYRNQRERVRGRRPRTQFQVQLSAAELPELVAELDRALGDRAPARSLISLHTI